MIDFHKTMSLGRKLLDKHGLTDWKLDVCNLRDGGVISLVDANGLDFFRQLSNDCVMMGICFPEYKTIYVDWHSRQRTARQTILHEIAHALTPEDNDHGRQWQDKAGAIGCTFAHTLPYVPRATGVKQR